MNTVSPLSSTLPTASASAASRPADSPEAAARQFESVLVRQFVEVMTKDLFDGGPEGGMTGQADLQRDTLTDTLTDHLVESGTFGVADLMIAQWRRSGRLPPEAPGSTQPPPPADQARTPLPSGSRPMTMDEALKMVPTAKARPVSFDHPQAPTP